MSTPEDQEPLMGVHDDKSLIGNNPSLLQRWNIVSIKVKFGIHCFLVLLYTGLCAAVLLSTHKRSHENQCPNSIISSTEVIYKPKITPNFLHNEFSGRNHHEIDLKWHDLLDNISLRATDEEMARNRNHPSSVSLPEGGGQLVWLEASHHLHCVKMLRQWSYRDVYFATADEMTMLKMSRHIDHCLELLRQVVMCRPDTSLTTFLWVNSQDKPILNIDSFEHQCVDWDAMVASLKDRIVPLAEIEALKNPLHASSDDETESGNAHISLPLGNDDHHDH